MKWFEHRMRVASFVVLFFFTAVESLAKHVCDNHEFENVRHGRTIRCRSGRPDDDDSASSAQRILTDNQMVALLRPDGQLIALARYCRHDQTLAPGPVFLTR